MKTLTLLTKNNCELCDIAKDIILKIKSNIPFHFQQKYIDTDSELFEKYKFKIPVILIDGEEKFFGRISEKLIKAELQ